MVKKIISLFLIFNFLYAIQFPIYAQNIKEEGKIAFLEFPIDKKNAHKILSTKNKNNALLNNNKKTQINHTTSSSKESKKSNFIEISKFNKLVGKGDVTKLKQMLNKGFDINQTCCKMSFFIEAINKKQNQSIDFLIQNGANPNLNCIIPPLYYSVIKNYPYATKKLLEAGANQDEMYMDLTAEKLAIGKNNLEILKIFDEYNNSKITNSTKISDALYLLKTNPVTKGFYQIINGENDKHNAFKIIYSHMSLFYNKNIYNNVLARMDISDSDYCIYINEKLKNSSKEAIATLIASQIFHMDDKDSINEEAYSALTMATVWNSFTIKNPKLREENSLLVRTLNEYENDLISNNFDLQAFKNKISENPTYIALKLPMESPGFTNDLLDLPKDKNFYEKTKINLQKYWNNTTTSEKVYNTCYFLAYTSIIIGGKFIVKVLIQ